MVTGRRGGDGLKVLYSNLTPSLFWVDRCKIHLGDIILYMISLGEAFGSHLAEDKESGFCTNNLTRCDHVQKFVPPPCLVSDPSPALVFPNPPLPVGPL